MTNPFDCPRRTFDFTFEPRRRPGAILACRRMRQPVNLQGRHHILEGMTFGHLPVVELQYFRAPNQTSAAALIKEKIQR